MTILSVYNISFIRHLGQKTATTTTKTHHLHGEHIQCFSWGSDDFKVVLEDGDGATQSLVATPTEQGHAHVEEDRGDEGGPGQTAHTSLTALLTA